jgi:hypothetical protein
MRSFKRCHIAAVLLIASAHSAVSLADSATGTNWYQYRNTLVALSSNGEPMCVALPARPNNPTSCLQLGNGVSSTDLQMYANNSTVAGTLLVCDSATYQAAYGLVPDNSSHWCNAFKSVINSLSPVAETPIPAVWYVYRNTIVALAPNGEPMCIEPPTAGNGGPGGCLQLNGVNRSELGQVVSSGVFAGDVLKCNSSSYQAMWGPVPDDLGHWCNAFKSDVLTLNPL